jgi:hypothetical protein
LYGTRCPSRGSRRTRPAASRASARDTFAARIPSAFAISDVLATPPSPAGASEAELKKRTLTNLYNRRPTWLDLAHRKLDQAVFAAYGWPADQSDEEILSRLLALNLQRAGAQQRGNSKQS